MPEDARGIHPAGLADRYGFAAMACTETLVHTWDIACGLGVDFTPPEDIAAKSLARLFPGFRTRATRGRRCSTPRDDGTWAAMSGAPQTGHGNARP